MTRSQSANLLMSLDPVMVLSFPRPSDVSPSVGVLQMLNSVPETGNGYLARIHLFLVPWVAMLFYQNLYLWLRVKDVLVDCRAGFLFDFPLGRKSFVKPDSVIGYTAYLKKVLDHLRVCTVLVLRDVLLVCLPFHGLARNARRDFAPCETLFVVCHGSPCVRIPRLMEHQTYYTLSPCALDPDKRPHLLVTEGRLDRLGSKWVVDGV